MKSILDFITVFKDIETYKGPGPRTMANGGIIIPPEKPKLPQLKIFADRLRTYVKAGAIKKDYATQLLKDKMEELGVSDAELGTITGRRGEADGGRIGLKPGGIVEPGIEYYGKTVITPEIEKKIITIRKKKKIGAPAIAEELGISRAPVGKYLKKAKEERKIPHLEHKDITSYKKLKRYEKRPRIHNTIHSINPMDKAPKWAKYKIQFSSPVKGTLTNIPKNFQGIQFFRDMKGAKNALNTRLDLTPKLLAWNYEDMIGNVRAVDNPGNAATLEVWRNKKLELNKGIVDHINKNKSFTTKNLANKFNMKLDDMNKMLDNISRGIYKANVGEGGKYLEKFGSDTLRDVIKKIRSSDFKSKYERSIYSLVVDAYPPGSKQLLAAREELKNYFKMNDLLANKYPQLYNVLDHTVPYAFIKEIEAGKSPKNLIKVRPIPEMANQFKTLIDNRTIKLNRALKENPANKELLTQFRELNSIKKQIPLEFGKITAKGDIVSYGARAISGTSDLVKEMRTGNISFNKLIELGKNIENNPALKDLLTKSELNQLKNIGKVKPVADKELKNILSGWCNKSTQRVGKDEGGRIGFAGCPDSEKITNMKDAAAKLKQHDRYLRGLSKTTPFADNAAAKALASKMAKSGGLLMRAGRVVMGPLTLWGEPLFEAAFVAHDILGTGTPWKEAVAKSLWAKPAIAMGLLKPADQQYDEALWQVQNEGETLMMDPYHERVRTPIKRFIDNNNKIDKLNKLYKLKQTSYIMGPKAVSQDKRAAKMKKAGETYNNYLESLGGAEGVTKIKAQIENDREAYDTRVAALETERQGWNDPEYEPSYKHERLKEPTKEMQDLMYQKYGKEWAGPSVGIKGTLGEFKKKWIIDPEILESEKEVWNETKTELDKELKQFGDEYGYGWTPYGHGFGMQQMKPGIGDKKYNEELGYKQLLKYINTMASGGRAGYMGGGITGIRKPSAIAPTGGPQSQGLASTPEYDTYSKEYKWQI